MSNLIKINDKNFDIILDIRYATTNNVCNQILYHDDYSALHPEAYTKFEKAVEYAKNLGYKFKVFDTYRPFAVQKFMFEYFQKFPQYQSFFSNPETGSTPHCRGVAIDLTLCDLFGNEVDMGSDFDELSDLAFHNCLKISPLQLNNRNTLLGIMMFAGFDFYNKEWWHYQLFDARKYEVILDN